MVIGHIPNLRSRPISIIQRRLDEKKWRKNDPISACREPFGRQSKILERTLGKNQDLDKRTHWPFRRRVLNVSRPWYSPSPHIIASNEWRHRQKIMSNIPDNDAPRCGPVKIWGFNSWVDSSERWSHKAELREGGWHILNTVQAQHFICLHSHIIYITEETRYWRPTKIPYIINKKFPVILFLIEWS